MKLTNLKEWYTNILGLLIMTFAVTGHYFQWPLKMPVNWWAALFVTVIELGLGVLLMFAHKDVLIQFFIGALNQLLSKIGFKNS